MKGKIKKIGNIFKPYKNPFLSLHRRLIAPDEKSDRFLEQLKEVQKYNLFQAYIIHPLKTLYVTPQISKIDGTNSDIINFIHHFTCSEEVVSEETLKKLKDEVLKAHSYELEDIIYKNRKTCKIKYKNGKIIKFNTITSSFKNIEEGLPDLITFDRNGRCHARSIILTEYINNPCHCVTGSIWNYSPRAKYLHSWVEMEHDDTTYCIDNNWNAVLKKEDYYFLQHPKIVERISQKRIKEDFDKIIFLNNKSTNENHYVKLYCTSPNEALEKYEELKAQEDFSSSTKKESPFYIKEL